MGTKNLTRSWGKLRGNATSLLDAHFLIADNAIVNLGDVSAVYRCGDDDYVEVLLRTGDRLFVELGYDEVMEIMKMVANDG